ncbi:MAG: TonB-dependent receptor, partial [Bacteroidia bacterium]|nr:TonB-dependent receptor [Bacteroidia bacterium]
REINTSTRTKSRTLNINSRLIARGGYRKTPINVSASKLEGETVFNETLAYTEQFEDYFRIDLGVAFNRNREKFNRTWSIDIQNVFNTENVAWESWDNQTQRVEIKNQLGIIPILSYRLTF